MERAFVKQILLDNQQDFVVHQLIPRQNIFDEFANYVLVGIRRAGKSYLLYQRIQELLASGYDWSDLLYINFEDERLIDFNADDLNLLLEIHLELYDKRPILFLDEIQNIDGWEKFARRLADKKYRVYITGSNAKMLSSDVQSTLGGRFLTQEVYPYNFLEFLRANEINLDAHFLSTTQSRANVARLLEDYFTFGGFPEGAQLQAKRHYLTSVYQKIYLGDIAARHQIENKFALRLLFKKLAESIKQPLSFRRIAQILSSTGAKIATQTVINYINYAKDAWLLTPVQNIASKMVDKESNPKYYFIDNGILSLLLVDAQTSLMENIVAINLLRRYGREDSVYFYNKGIEVDFYIPEEEMAIQVCYQLHSSPETLERESKALLKLSKHLPCRRLIIITRDEEESLHLEGQEIELISLQRWLLSEPELSL